VARQRCRDCREQIGVGGARPAGRQRDARVRQSSQRRQSNLPWIQGISSISDEYLTPKNDDQKAGVEIVRKALSTPARQIATNAGEDGSVIVGKILEKDHYAYGFDAQNGEYVNLVSKGIIDPTKVVRAALQNAASIAGLLITTEAMVAERPKKDSGAPAMPGCGMGGMDY
jgi:chaperonin GroEL (HSP60 family)